MRLKYKKEGNPLQEIIKLILNSIYGKTILNPIVTKNKFIDNRKILNYINDNYHNIIELNGIEGSEKSIISEIKSDKLHYSFPHLGCNILSMSKRIMNEVMCLAEDLGIKIFYQDTDSMMLYQKDLDTLSNAFKKNIQGI
jgi:DNA polymerase elongation subunit (family B)